MLESNTDKEVLTSFNIMGWPECTFLAHMWGPMSFLLAFTSWPLHVVCVHHNYQK